MTVSGGELAGRRALVSGAASGIGAAIVRRLQSEGAKVAGLDLLPSPGADCQLLADLRDGAALSAALAQMEQQLGGAADIVVHAAAITAMGGVLDVEPGRYGQIYEVNVVGAVRLLQLCVPAMREAGKGAFVLMSSINADFATPSQAAYAMSKAALNNLALTAALELAPQGIRVNAIAPASIDTPAMRASIARQPDPEAASRANWQRHPIARWGTAEEVAELALFLASDRASWITGSIHRIDGGASVTRR
ncbi:SDR family NAD(P)-dependent oxidoreductase [Pelomonas sp. KK5]|uniref:SDR family NAD(P)-dependent oxidoreductase n=1 Tax=Pelomonas sp. KK5 TaxID=1855730 RepID=UPI00097C88E6|nr:SDR family oxidoreductase [Pelomonas sp. KK5]